MVLADSHGISRVPRYSGTCPPSRIVVVYRTVTFCGLPFQGVRLTIRFVTRRALRPRQALQPQRASSLVWAVPRSLAATSGITDLFSVPAGTEMVHFPALPSTLLWIQSGILRDKPEWVAPFGHPRVKACLRLTGAYRSLPRPSSTVSAKAFTVRP
jgi:hypothetical protein